MEQAFSAIILTSFLLLCICAVPSQSLRGADCLKQTCGNLKLSYPFKLHSEPNCPSFSSFFELECRGGELYLHNFTQIQRGGLIVDLPMRVLQIHTDSLIVDATGLSAVMTRSEDGDCTIGDSTSLLLPDFPGPFVLAHDNLFGSFGCTMGVVLGEKMLKNMSMSKSSAEVGGCSVLCPGNENRPGCGGHTCCVSSLDQGISFRGAFYLVNRSPFITNSEEFNSSPCNNNYATLFDPKFSNQSYGLKLEWALPSNQTNSTMDIKSSSNFACSNHSNITIVPEVPGYRCSCQRGFDGDGYSLGSPCSDIDECTTASLNDCIPHKSTCHNNVEGIYSCKCNSRFHVGDGLRKGYGCNFSPTLRNALAIIGGLLITGLVSLVIYWRSKRKKRYVLVNEGIQLQDITIKAG